MGEMPKGFLICRIGEGQNPQKQKEQMACFDLERFGEFLDSQN